MEHVRGGFINVKSSGFYTLNSATVSGHVKQERSSLAVEIEEESAGGMRIHTHLYTIILLSRHFALQQKVTDMSLL